MKSVEGKVDDFITNMEDVVINDEKKRVYFINMNKDDVINKKKDIAKVVKPVTEKKENDEENQGKESNKEEDQEEDEEEEMPEEIKKMPIEKQQREILKLSFKTMGIGTLLVILFSDPMVGMLSAFGKIIGVPAFYVSFILAPLASNASELLAAYS